MNLSPTLVDSNVLIGGFNPKDEFHKPAARILFQMEQGKVDKPIITDYILDEVLTFVRRRLGFDRSLAVLDSILASDVLGIEKVGEREFQAGIIIFEKNRRLSFTDSVSVAMMDSMGAKRIVSFDKDFDSVHGIERVSSPMYEREHG